MRLKKATECKMRQRKFQEQHHRRAFPTSSKMPQRLFNRHLERERKLPSPYASSHVTSVATQQRERRGSLCTVQVKGGRTVLPTTTEEHISTWMEPFFFSQAVQGTAAKQ